VGSINYMFNLNFNIMATWERIAVRAEARVSELEKKCEKYEKAYREAKAIIYNIQNKSERRPEIEIHASLDTIINS
jgi:molecular chaperone GrpE (heat shock protein)